MKSINKNLSVFRKVLLSISIVMVLFSGNTFAQNEINKIPELNEHVFIPNANINSPFMNTYLDISVGIGTTGQFKYPVFEVDDQPIYAVRGELLYATVGLAYQQKIQDWAALYIRYNLAARLGTNVGSILAEGFSTVNAFNIGWKIRIIEHDKYRLSGSVGIANYKGSFISISRFVEDIINNNPNPSLVNNVPALNGMINFQFAYGFNELFGLKAELQNSIGESLERGETAYFFSLGTSFDVNFQQKYNVPLGVSLTYSMSTQPDQVFRESGLANNFIFRISYTGTTDFLIGLVSSYSFVPVSDVDKGDFTVYGTAFAITYYFN